MSYEFKTIKREHFSKTKIIILILKNLKKFYDQITAHLQFFKSIIFIIIHRLHRKKNQFLKFTKRIDRFLKFDVQIKRRLMRHVKTNSFDNFNVLIIFFKSEKRFHRTIVRRYLKKSDYLRFKIRKKFYLTFKHKLARLK